MDPRTKSHFYKSASDFKLEGSIDISETGDHHSASVLRKKKMGVVGYESKMRVLIQKNYRYH